MVLLAFADANPAKPVRKPYREEKAIRDALEQLITDGKLDVPTTLWNATEDGIIGVLRKDRFRGRIRVFHFAGHASGTKVTLADEEGAQAFGFASSLAHFLGTQESLTLVVLNGCSTQAQVDQLRKAGVRAVIATRRAIRDDVAADFATQLYAELAARPLKAAFEAASAAVRGRRGENPRELVQEDLVLEEEWNAPWPWVLACPPELDDWRLV